MANPSRPAPQSSVRPMLASDLTVVLRIAKASLPNPWSAAIWRDELSSPFGLYLVLEDGGEPAGFIGVKHVADETHVMTVAVVPERRGRGHGRTLVEAALGLPTSRATRRVHLEVRPSNAAARTLYASLGFVETGVRKGYYGNEDAVLMTLELPGPTRGPSLAPLALAPRPAPRLSPPLEVLGGAEGLEEVEGRGETEQEAEEDPPGDERVDGAADHIDQEFQQQDQRDKRE